MSALTRANIELLTIDKGRNSVSILPPRTIALQYYESLLSPIVTANLLVVDVGLPAGNSVSKQQNIQQKSGSLLSSLPITGNEIVKLKLKNSLGRLDFEKFPFRVDKAPTIGKESNRESYFISLLSGYSFDNERSAVYKSYKNSISESVTSILKEHLKVPDSRLKNIEPTRYGYNFHGNGDDPFSVILKLSSKSTPAVKGDPGYFFYETQNGFNFRSISSLMSQKPKNEGNPYRQTGVLRENDPQSDYKILSYTQSKNQSVLDALRTGVYSTKNIFFNPRTFEYTEKIVSLKSDGLKKYLGKNVEIPEGFEEFTRTHYHILDVGSLDSDVSVTVNNNPMEWQAKSTMRYNLLFTQVVQINVPCNPNLVAGDVIYCDLPYITVTKDSTSVYDEQFSGKYLILHLCHSFDLSAAGKSYTALTLVKDTYGKYVK
jgi:hypothetical protein